MAKITTATCTVCGKIKPCHGSPAVCYACAAKKTRELAAADREHSDQD